MESGRRSTGPCTVTAPNQHGTAIRSSGQTGINKRSRQAATDSHHAGYEDAPARASQNGPGLRTAWTGAFVWPIPMTEDPRFNQKLIAAKLKQLERFRKDKKERAVSQERRRLPPGQTWTDGFPVLDLGVHPEFDPETWELRVYGDVETPVALSWKEFQALPHARLTSDFHCVTTWSKQDVDWGGVRVADVLALARPRETARFLIQHCGEGYTTNTSVFEATQADALLADSLDGKPLPLEHGGPVRMMIPTLYAWKSGKFVRALELSALDKPGYWETRGYHNNADPWREERHGEPPSSDEFLRDA